MRGVRRLFTERVIKLACDGDAASYSPLAKAFRGLTLETIRSIAALVESEERS